MRSASCRYFLKRTSWSISKPTTVLRIESLSYHGGRGVGRANGEVIFVPETAPGDLVKVEIIEKEKNYSVGVVLERLEESAERVVPPCPVFKLCGGCDWQHISYPEQLRQKQGILEASFRNINKNYGPLQFQPFRASPLPYRYRNRIQLHRKGTQIGYFRRGTHDLIAIEDCHLVEKEIAEVLPTLLRHPQKEWGKKFEIARTESGPVQVVSHQGNPQFVTFSQVNSAQNRQLIETVLAQIHSEPKEILDLYCGHGNFTLPLARHFPNASVTGVELSSFNVQIANQKKSSQNLSNVAFVANDVLSFLTQASTPPGGLILLDPPRTGLARDVLKRVIELKPSTLIYISCQPMTLTRDLDILLKGSDLKIEWVEGFDMFPQTAHVEVLTVMRRQSS